MTLPMLRLLVPCSAMALLAACGSSPAEDPTDTGPDAQLEVGGEDVEADIADLSLPETTDAAVDADTVDAPESGQFGDPCSSADDCESARCLALIAGSDEAFCTLPCAENADCPRDFDCVLVGDTGGDRLQLCVPETLCIDNDGDGFGIGPDCLGSDCDDANDQVNPRAEETCNGVDDNCDERIDNNTRDEGDDCVTSFPGVCREGRIACVDGFSECQPRRPSAPELCNGLDDDCDGETDESAPGVALSRSCYDGPEGTDGVGVCAAGTQTCIDAGYTSCRGQTLPSSELCNGLDDNCDGRRDDGLTARTWYPDLDNDGFGGIGGVPVESCIQPEGYAPNDTDCNDDDPNIHPEATEVVADGVDSDCDGLELCWADADFDRFRSDATVPSGDRLCLELGLARADAPDGDCDDLDPDINPGVPERPGDEFDQNCDGRELCYADADNDGYRTSSTVASVNMSCRNTGEALTSTPDGDCNDANDQVHPGRAEVCDGVDQDCDDSIDEGLPTTMYYLDADRDTYGSTTTPPVASCRPLSGYVLRAGDCNDGNPSINEAAAEVPGDNVDQDCDGTEVCFADADNDGYRPNTVSTVPSIDADCNDAGEAISADPTGDCNDANAAAFPGNTETHGDEIDNNCDGVEICFVDADNDGYRAAPLATVDSLNESCRDSGEAAASEPGGDCNDGDGGINPGRAEIVGNGRDENCDGAETCYADADNDGYRPNSGTVASPDADCDDSGEARSTEPTGDCDDSNGSVNPGRTETCNSTDDDCDGGIDEGFSVSCQSLACTGTGVIATISDACLDDGGATSGGDSMQIYCVNNIARFCLSGESCPWRDGTVTPDTQTCSRSGLSNDRMGTASCQKWNSWTNYYCSTTLRAYFD